MFKLISGVLLISFIFIMGAFVIGESGNHEEIEEIDNYQIAHDDYLKCIDKKYSEYENDVLYMKALEECELILAEYK